MVRSIFKPNVAPTVLDQYRHQKAYTRVLPNGEKVVVDPEVCNPSSVTPHGLSAYNFPDNCPEDNAHLLRAH